MNSMGNVFAGSKEHGASHGLMLRVDSIDSSRDRKKKLRSLKEKENEETSEKIVLCSRFKDQKDIWQKYCFAADVLPCRHDACHSCQVSMDGIRDRWWQPWLSVQSFNWYPTSSSARPTFSNCLRYQWEHIWHHKKSWQLWWWWIPGSLHCNYGLKNMPRYYQNFRKGISTFHILSNIQEYSESDFRYFWWYFLVSMIIIVSWAQQFCSSSDYSPNCTDNVIQPPSNVKSFPARECLILVEFDSFYSVKQ